MSAGISTQMIIIIAGVITVMNGIVIGIVKLLDHYMTKTQSKEVVAAIKELSGKLDSSDTKVIEYIKERDSNFLGVYSDQGLVAKDRDVEIINVLKGMASQLDINYTVISRLHEMHDTKDPSDGSYLWHVPRVWGVRLDMIIEKLNDVRSNQKRFMGIEDQVKAIEKLAIHADGLATDINDKIGKALYNRREDD